MILTILYPRATTTRFDEAYFTAHHIPMIEDRLAGLLDRVDAVAFADEGAPYRMMTLMRFASDAALEQAMALPAMADLQADLAAFTDCVPEAHIGRPAAL